MNLYRIRLAAGITIAWCVGWALAIVHRPDYPAPHANDTCDEGMAWEVDGARQCRTDTPTARPIDTRGLARLRAEIPSGERSLALEASFGSLAACEGFARAIREAVPGARVPQCAPLGRLPLTGRGTP